MATKYWEPKAQAVSQVSTVQITANDTATTYKITINGIVVSVTGNASGVNDTASDLQVALEASTHPYFTPITFTVATDTVTMTGTAGLPFTATSSVTGGTGTIGAVATGTNATGPNNWDNASNWSTGAVPVNSDDVIINNSSTSILFGLDQSSVTLDSLRIDKSFTGFIGLNARAVATTANGETTDSTAPEYNDVYLQIGTNVLDIGENFNQDTPAGSSRILIDLGSNACQTTIYNTASITADAGRPAFRFKANSSSSDFFVRSAPGGFGIAADVPGETSTVGDVTITDTSVASRINITSGVTITNFTQTGGTNFVNAAATVTSLDISGGILTTEGDYTITTVTQSGGTYNSNHIKTAGNAITTLNLNGGILTTQGNAQARTFATTNLNNAGTLTSDGSIVTLTTINELSGRYTLSLSEQG